METVKMAGEMAWPQVEKIVKLPQIKDATPVSNGDVMDTSAPDTGQKNTEEGNTAPLRGRKRFSQVAFRVIQQLYDKDKIVEADEEADVEIAELSKQRTNYEQQNKCTKPEPVKSKWKRLSSVADLSKSLPNRSDSSMSNSKPKMRTPTPTRKKPSIASVIRLASLNKSINGKNKKGKGGRETPSKTKDPEKEDGEEADEADLPQTSRFCTSLSGEAQFAMLKCYEDLILDGIGDDSRQVDECPPYLLRVKSPVQRIEAIHIEERPVSRKNKRSDVPKSTPTTDHTNPTDLAVENKTEETLTPASNENDNILISADNTQLRLSYRFQTAMDMLDNIKLGQGRNITTPRERMHKVKQLDSERVYTQYNTWSKNWSKDFKYQFGK